MLTRILKLSLISILKSMAMHKLLSPSPTRITRIFAHALYLDPEQGYEQISLPGELLSNRQTVQLRQIERAALCTYFWLTEGSSLLNYKT